MVANMSDTTTTTTTTPKNGSNSSGCPYAAALSDDSDHSRGSSRGSLSEKCPAFASSCPFKTAKSATEVKQTLLQLPASHLEKSGDFFRAIEHIHRIHTDMPNEEKKIIQSTLLSGEMKCPMQGYYSVLQEHQQEQQKQQSVTTTTSFGLAMEHCSLSAIMARMAKDMEGFNDSFSTSDHDDITPVNMIDDEEGKATTSATNMSISTTPASTRPSIMLAEALKTGTAVSHKAAEDVEFVNDFIKGKIDRDSYRQLVLSLYYIYEKLEACLDEHATTYFPSCYYPEKLNRVDALKEDLDFWFGTNAVESMNLPQPSPATQDYIDRIDYIAKTDPLLLLSHSYTRYLGDLSGGKILARVARRALDLAKTGEGLAFYEFENITSPKKFKDEYRLQLDSLQQLTKTDIDNLVSEANVSFCLNIRIFQELSINEPIVMPLEEALTMGSKNKKTDDPHHGITDEDDDAKCPFLVDKNKKNKNKAAVVDSTMATTAAVEKKGQCPWPFILLHDPYQGMKDFKSWIVFGFLLSWIWSKLS